MFFSLKVRTAGEGLVVNTLMMPIGNDNVMSPVIFTMHLVGSAPLKYALTDSVKATAMGKASWDARVTGLGPRDVPTVGVLPALSEALEDKEEELSARARGAIGGGLDVLGGLNGRTISLIPVSFPAGSLGLEEGRGGGTKAPGARGVVGRFGTGTVDDDTAEEDPTA